MEGRLSQPHIAKYAARLQGQRLLPVLQEWQIKRAIVRLASDGSRPSLDAIKQGVEKGLLGKPPYSALLEFVLAGSVAPADAKRVRAHLRHPEPIKKTEPQPQPQPRPQRDWSSGVVMGTKAPPPVKAEPESFSTTNNPIQLLQEQLKTSAPLDSNRVELRERVRQDNSRKLLQEICELWDRSVGLQKETLRELIAFIELVPERPLWLRRNVALDCGMPWQLADDSPAIVQHLVDTIQLRTRKGAVLSAIRKLRREDAKAEICELWFGQYKQGADDADFDDVLLQLGFLPKSPLEQRVAVALTCGWAERLVYDDTEVLIFLLPLLDHPRLGAEARRALENIKNPSTLKALEDQRAIETTKVDERDSVHQQEENDQSALNQRVEAAVETEVSDEDSKPATESALTEKDAEVVKTASPEFAGPGHAVESLPVELEAAKTDTSEPEERLQNSSSSLLDTPVDNAKVQHGTILQEEELDRPETYLPPRPEPSRTSPPKPYLDSKHGAQLEDDWEEHSLAEAGWDDEVYPDIDWISRLDRIAGLAPEERNKIISQIADSSIGDDDWIFDLQSASPSSPLDPLDTQQQGRGQDRVMVQDAQTNREQRGSTQRDSNESRNIDNLTRLKKLLSSKGLRAEDDGQSLRVSVAIGDYTQEIDAIEIHVLNELKYSDAIEYADACIGMANDMGSKPIEVGAEVTDDIQEASDTHAAEEACLSTLYLDDLASAALDSASVFLTGCASELLNSQAKKQHLLSPFQELIAGLLTFHTRERSAEIKAYEEAMESNQEALLNNSDCIAGAFLEEISPYKEDVYAARYRFDPQQSFRHSTRKGKSKPKVICQQSHTLLEIDSIDNTTGIATVLVKADSKDCLERQANFIYVPPNFSQTLRQDLAQQAPHWIHGKKPLSDAFDHLLQRTGSNQIEDLNQRVDDNPSSKTALISDFLRSSDGISLVIQGPPGSGKTSCAAEVICNMVRSGLKIGVSANSHLAIDTLLSKVSSVAQALKQNVRIAKYQPTITAEDRNELARNDIRVINKQTFNMLYDVYGGTAHAFSKQIFAELYDLLVIDEASQVPLASLLAMARCARNILLIGDQQQLAQPIIADHPGESGLSCLGYATANQQVVDKRIGIFLPKSWRMHPRTCGFISSSFYEERLLSHQDNSANSIPLSSVKNGILYIPVEHDKNRVFSVEEAEAIKEIASLLIGQKCSVSKSGKSHEIAVDWEHIAIMAPYNAQVSLIQRVLGPEARVGTVDRFQGQEAPISIYSLTTSHGDNPSALEFVLNRNRVNVALSRSQCLSIVVGSPSLTSILNSSPELTKERELLFSLTDYVGTSFSLTPSRVLDVASPSDAEKSSENTFLIIDGFAESTAAAPLPDDLKDPSTIKLARKLFKFSIDSTELLKLYHYRLFDELALYLDFCSWDKTERLWEQTKLLMRLAASPNATPLLLVKLAKRGEWKTREAVAANPKTPLHVIKDLIDCESVMGRRGAAQNPELPEEIYWELWSDSDELVGRSLASNPSMPREIVHRLTESSYEITSRLALENLLIRETKERLHEPDTHKPTESDPSRSFSSDSPLSLASDPSTPASVLSSLVSSHDQKVRTALASNPSLSPDDIHVLAFDSNDAVRIRIAERTDLPSDVLTALAFDQSRFVRRILAENPTCTDNAFKRLVSDSDVYVRERVARQVSLSKRVCSWLLAESEARVILALADNANVPISYFVEAQKEYYLNSLTGNKPTALKALLLISEACPVQQLAGVAIAQEPTIRLALAFSPHSTASSLQSLLNDDDSVIRDIVTRRLSMLEP
jgi:hypothetical protein